MGMRDFWKKIDDMAEEQRLKIPVWCVWATNEDRGGVNSGYALYRTVTREEAIAKFRSFIGGIEGRDMLVSCCPATQKQIDEHRRIEQGWGTPPGPTNPRLRMEKV